VIIISERNEFCSLARVQKAFHVLEKPGLVPFACREKTTFTTGFVI
jgi:hypothetical protein